MGAGPSKAWVYSPRTWPDLLTSVHPPVGGYGWSALRCTPVPCCGSPSSRPCGLQASPTHPPEVISIAHSTYTSHISPRRPIAIQETELLVGRWRCLAILAVQMRICYPWSSCSKVIPAVFDHLSPLLHRSSRAGPSELRSSKCDFSSRG